MEKSPGQDDLLLVAQPSAASTEEQDFYLRPNAQTIRECSAYSLTAEERYLAGKYFASGGTILDLACGLGRTTLCLHELGLPVVGMDFSEALIQFAQRRLPCLDFRVGSMTETGEPDASYPFVFVSSQAVDLLNTLRLRVDALHECARILQRGGTLIYSSYNLKCLHLLSPRHWRRPFWKLGNTIKAFKSFARVQYGDFNGFFAAPEALIEQTKQAGFSFVEMRGPAMSASPLFNRYRSLYIYYVFRKI